MFSLRTMLLATVFIAISNVAYAQNTDMSDLPVINTPVNPIVVKPLTLTTNKVNDIFSLENKEDILRTMHRNMVSKALPITDDTQALWESWATEGWKTNNGKTINTDQAVVVVNRNTKVQKIAVMIAHPNGTWTLIGVSPTSTGQAGRKTHFISPVGIFDHDGSNMDYRAEGTKNKNGIRGIGAKGSRVWDFGWQTAQTGWLVKPEQRTIRFELHATDPDLLEQRLGHPASEGCIRISAGLNKFLDHFSILDEVYLEEAPDSKAIDALLVKDRNPTLPGRYLMVVDVNPAFEKDADKNKIVKN